MIEYWLSHTLCVCQWSPSVISTSSMRDKPYFCINFETKVTWPCILTHFAAKLVWDLGCTMMQIVLTVGYSSLALWIASKSLTNGIYEVHIESCIKLQLIVSFFSYLPCLLTLLFCVLSFLSPLFYPCPFSSKNYFQPTSFETHTHQLRLTILEPTTTVIPYSISLISYLSFES